MRVQVFVDGSVFEREAEVDLIWILDIRTTEELTVRGHEKVLGRRWTPQEKKSLDCLGVVRTIHCIADRRDNLDAICECLTSRLRIGAGKEDIVRYERGHEHHILRLLLALWRVVGHLFVSIACDFNHTAFISPSMFVPSVLLVMMVWTYSWQAREKTGNVGISQSIAAAVT